MVKAARTGHNVVAKRLRRESGNPPQALTRSASKSRCPPHRS